MKKIFLTVAIAVAALTSSINANAMTSAEGESTIAQVAANLNPEEAYYYTILCQRFVVESEQILESDKLTDKQKQNRISALTGIYVDRFSEILDSWQTMTTIQELTK